MHKKIHIVCLDIPFPANYGGAIDMFYKIKYLAEAGCKITLHCFQYGDRYPSEELNQYCTNVYYYKRTTGIRGLHHSFPYIVSSRNDKQLLVNLCEDDSPILFDGLHTTYLINHPSLKNRTKMLRVHNIEAEYYQQLALNCNSGLKKLYYFFEAGRLKLYEKSLYAITHFLSISLTEYDFFKKEYPLAIHDCIPAFHSNEQVTTLVGQGEYVMYHGNLSVEENIHAAMFLIENVISQLKIPFIIAGKNPSVDLMKYQSEQVTILANPSDKEFKKLIENAHIHLLPAYQNTGLKLKLLNALYQGRFCIANSTMLEGSGLESLVHLAESSEDWISSIEQILKLSFTIEQLEERKKGLEHYENRLNATKLLQLI